MNTIQNNQDLLSFLIAHANSGVKNWFGYQQQRIAGISLAYKIAERHAPTMTPEEVTRYVVELNNSIFKSIIEKK